VLYREALSRAGKPVPAPLLLQMSGDLGSAGHLPEILQLVEPHFVPAEHGLMVANNLVKANLDLGRHDVARRIVDQLYAFKRPDWRQNLAFWDAEIAKARLSIANQSKGPVQPSLLTIEGPIWLQANSAEARFFPVKTPEKVSVAFM